MFIVWLQFVNYLLNYYLLNVRALEGMTASVCKLSH